MLKNNNQPVIKRIAKTNLKSNFRRSITMIFAVLLSSFLLFSVFTVGLTYLKMNKLQNIRLNGADFDAVLYGVGDLLLGQTGSDDAVALSIGIEADVHIDRFSKGVKGFDIVQAGAVEQIVQLPVVLGLLFLPNLVHCQGQHYKGAQ